MTQRVIDYEVSWLGFGFARALDSGSARKFSLGTYM